MKRTTGEENTQNIINGSLLGQHQSALHNFTD